MLRIRQSFLRGFPSGVCRSGQRGEKARKTESGLLIPRKAITKKGGIYLDSVYSEIEKIRCEHFFSFSENLPDRHCVLCREAGGGRTAYYFSVPIRNIQSNAIVDLKFHHHNQDSVFYGSNCKMIVSDKIRLMNEHGQCEILIPGKPYKKTDHAIFFKDESGEAEIRPTLNGTILLFGRHLSKSHKTFTMRTNRPFESTRTNNRCFSIMREKSVPFVTASCIGLADSHDKICAPCEMFSQKAAENEYILHFGDDGLQNRIAVEINIQEQKLFQDTTVESLHPTANNAFGGTSFLGTSKMLGEQWLYSRLDMTKLASLQGKKIIKSILHIPQLGSRPSPITISKIAERFCSFGSNWENKIAVRDTLAWSSDSTGYYHLDLTKLFGNFRNKSESFVIRSNDPATSAMIPTGDSFYSPQILEVRYQ